MGKTAEIQLNLKKEPSEEEIKKFQKEWDFKKRLTIFALQKKEIRVRLKDSSEVSGSLIGIDTLGNLWLDLENKLETGFFQRKDYQAVFLRKGD